MSADVLVMSVGSEPRVSESLQSVKAPAFNTRGGSVGVVYAASLMALADLIGDIQSGLMVALGHLTTYESELVYKWTEEKQARLDQIAADIKNLNENGIYQGKKVSGNDKSTDFQTLMNDYANDSSQWDASISPMQGKMSNSQQLVQSEAQFSAQEITMAQAMLSVLTNLAQVLGS